jgi:hypothetical protein
MLPITLEALRASFVNASRRELADMTVPDLAAVPWDDRTFLGWRDAKTPRRAYVVVPTLDDTLVGIVLKQAEAAPRSRAQCSWCQDVQLPNDVVFWSARRSGPAGRKGDTVGTLVCQDFECSRNVRTTPPPAYEGYDVDAARLRRMEDLQLRAASFAAEV